MIYGSEITLKRGNNMEYKKLEIKLILLNTQDVLTESGEPMDNEWNDPFSPVNFY